MNIAFTHRAREQMLIRSITEEIAIDVIAYPDKNAMQDGEIRVYQKIVAFGSEGNFLVRVFVNTLKLPPQVVTVYRTSKLDKYQ